MMDKGPEMQPDPPPTSYITQGYKWMFSGYLQSRLQCVVPTSVTETGQVQGLT